MPRTNKDTRSGPRPNSTTKAIRNAEIRAKYDPDNNSGYRTLSKEYGLSTNRIKQIVHDSRHQ